MKGATFKDNNGGCKMLLRYDCGARVQLPYVTNKSSLVVGFPLSCASRWKSAGDRKALLFMGLCQDCSPLNPYNVAKLLPFCLLFEDLGKQICQAMFCSSENCSVAHFLSPDTPLQDPLKAGSLPPFL